MRRPTSTRYDLVTSASAWAQIGTLDTRAFQELQNRLESLAWSAASFRQTGPNAPIGAQRLPVDTDELSAVCELDHVARRVTVISITRLTPALRSRKDVMPSAPVPGSDKDDSGAES